MLENLGLPLGKAITSAAPCEDYPFILNTLQQNIQNRDFSFTHNPPRINILTKKGGGGRVTPPPAPLNYDALYQPGLPRLTSRKENA